MDVERIYSDDYREWIMHKHYAHRMPSVSYAFGLFDDSKILQGVCTIGKPASNTLCEGVCGKQYEDYVYELNRLVVSDGQKKNTLSQFVSAVLRNINKDMILVSFADTSMGHHGYIYQATNWVYTGLSAKRSERKYMDNKDKHCRHIDCSDKNTVLVDRPRKHRYVYFIGTKRFKRSTMNSLLYKTEPYPKGDNTNYDASYEPTIQMRLF